MQPKTSFTQKELKLEFEQLTRLLQSLMEVKSEMAMQSSKQACAEMQSDKEQGTAAQQ